MFFFIILVILDNCIIGMRIKGPVCVIQLLLIGRNLFLYCSYADEDVVILEHWYSLSSNNCIRIEVHCIFFIPNCHRG